MLKKKLFRSIYSVKCDKLLCVETDSTVDLNREQSVKYFKDRGWWFVKKLFRTACLCSSCRKELNDTVDRLKSIKEELTKGK